MKKYSKAGGSLFFLSEERADFRHFIFSLSFLLLLFFGQAKKRMGKELPRKPKQQTIAQQSGNMNTTQ